MTNNPAPIESDFKFRTTITIPLSMPAINGRQRDKRRRLRLAPARILITAPSDKVVDVPRGP